MQMKNPSIFLLCAFYLFILNERNCYIIHDSDMNLKH